MGDHHLSAPVLDPARPGQDNAPTIPSPLNPEVRGRGQRERKETAKKREATATVTPLVPSKRKANGPAGRRVVSQSAPSPKRYQIPPPRSSDYEMAKPPVFNSHEPSALMTPDGKVELKKVTDQAENKRGYRYTLCFADANFRHKQFFRQTDGLPHGPRMSFEDADRSIHYDSSGHFVTNDKGWRTARANVCVREGSMYYEVRWVRGGAAASQANHNPRSLPPQPHVRIGWARREAPLDAPVGFDGYSYGIRDSRFDPMHRSRASTFFHPAKNHKSKNTPIELSEGIEQGDVIGMEMVLPSLSLHQKVVQGHYNPAIDPGDGFEDKPPLPDSTQEPHHIIRDRIPVPYKGNVYFETLDYQTTKPVDAYSSRVQDLSSPLIPTPIPNHSEPALRSLPHSCMRVYKNGNLIGTAFDNLLAFLPPASQPDNKDQGAREGLDDGMLGYFPAISCYMGGIAEVNFGENGFWMPPAHLKPTQVQTDPSDPDPRYYPGRTLRPIAERYKEQIAEDIVYDILDEVDFFMQDGGFGGKVGAGAGAAQNGRASLKEDND